MKSMIFVGGIQYTGKTSLCKRLESIDKRYKHLEMDNAYRHLAYNRQVFLNIIKKNDRDLFKRIMKFAKKCEFEEKSKSDVMTLFANYMIHENRYDEFNLLHKRCAMQYLGSQISSFDDNSIPVLDGMAMNEKSRHFVYSLLKTSITRFNLDDAKKLIVFFDTGLETSLLRHKSNIRPNNPNIIVNEQTLAETYKEQELPKNSEFPNLDVVVVRNELEIVSAIQGIAAFV